MNRIIIVSVGVLTITALCVVAFVLGKSHASQATETIKLNIDSTINGVISRLPEEDRDGVADLLTPLAQLIDARLETGKLEQEIVESTALNLQKSLQKLALNNYRADTSPFVPPRDKAQFICGEAFTLVYLGQDQAHQLHAKLKINSNVAYLSPGDINQYKTADKKLEIAYLEYKREWQGPLLKYVCHGSNP
ncbi:MAG: hypothetical protein JAY90_22725 [Candidatus Thiodiazotropha lotti]|nr:hypothetical protein [Candidatus Thiodiazotropha lotti]